MLIGIDYLDQGRERPAMLVAESRDAAESQFRRENPRLSIVRSWAYADMYEAAFLAADTGAENPAGRLRFGRRA